MPHLIIKTMHASIAPREWRKLQKIERETENIHLIDIKLNRADLINLYGSCDVLVSLHRAEGFGRVMAECFLLGLEVVATNYSGNTDFCQGDSYYPVNYQLTFVPEGTYTQSKDQYWGEPDVKHASLQLQKSIEALGKSKENSRELKSYSKKLSLSTVRRQLQAETSEIWSSQDSSSTTNME